MKIIHESRDDTFRQPFGAVTFGTPVHLMARLEDAPANTALTLRIWIDGEGETLKPMVSNANNEWTVDVTFPEPVIVWYSFIASWTDNTGQHEVHAGPRQGKTGGEAVIYEQGDAPSFQITVYKHREIRPEWYEKGMVYQIFPDRYRRDENWRERTEAALAKPRNGIARRMIENWTEPPIYERTEDGGIKCWDFYGGSLKGITGDLKRLAEMGITAIYLNPIFEAQSNHRYDTGDYMRIDPILGTEDDFKELCQEAAKLGISIILDGVFNHTGDDSLYFNRYNNYPNDGAWNNPDSPWRAAYKFNDDGTYACWWGIGNMPDLDGESPLVRELLLGEDGVIRHWLRAGARGWRLDVADELTEHLITDIKTALLEERPDGLLLGEVWEDASNKISYGYPRHYLLGSELDSAMNYPFRSTVIDFLMGNINAFDAADVIESIRENYPPDALYTALNLLGSHDRPRIASVLGGGPDESKLPESERGRWRLSPEAMGLAKARFWLATLIQMTVPGVPSIYYGDEFALEGLSDPGNRRTLPRPQDPRDLDMLATIRNASAIRRALPFMVYGEIKSKGLTNDVLSYTRYGKNGEAATILINRSQNQQATVRVPMLNEAATDIVSGTELKANDDGTVEITLWPFGSAVVYFHTQERLQLELEPGAGVLAHITSVPTATGTPGTLGARSKRFIDHLQKMGMRYWQVLPVNPTDSFNSPYAGPSAFAGNIDLLPWSEAELRTDYAAWSKRKGQRRDKEYRTFIEREKAWLEPYCAFMALKATFGGTRHDWPAKYTHYHEDMLKDPLLKDEAQVQAYIQYRFDCCWRDTLAYAHQHGINIIGDIPMYVSDDSADAWSRPELFTLDRDGKPTEIAGAPPDGFAPDGQVWGNPTYNWQAMKENNYRWWMNRLRRACDLYDYVRLDHFLGFHNFFSIPAGHGGTDGRWLAGPGRDLFDCAKEQLGALPFIAEDLGVLTPGVRCLVTSCGFPGMDVLEFSDYDVRQGLHPTPGKIFYTSTHDTSTLTGFVERSFFPPEHRKEAQELSERLITDALNSNARVVMIPLQDVLELGDEARMNVPGVADGNWSWQASESDIAAAEDHFAELMHKTGRFAE